MGDRLTEYVRSRVDDPFEWGRHDCLTFAAECVRIQTGTTPFREWVSGYDDAPSALRRYSRLRRNSIHADIIEGVDAVFERENTLYPDHGMLVARPANYGVLDWTFGVVVNGNPVLMTDEGVVRFTTEIDDLHWRVE